MLKRAVAVASLLAVLAVPSADACYQNCPAGTPTWGQVVQEAKSEWSRITPQNVVRAVEYVMARCDGSC